MKKIMGLWILLTVFGSSSLVMAQSKTSPISDEKAHEIVMTGTPGDVRKLLDSGYDVNKIYLCNTLLNSAIKSLVQTQAGLLHPEDVVEKIKILVNSGADVNLIACPKNSMSALHWAVSIPQQFRYLEVNANEQIDEKIKNNIGKCDVPEIGSKPCGKVTPEERKKISLSIKTSIQLACDAFSPYFMEIIDFLVTNGADINLRTSSEGMAPLHIAVMKAQGATLAPLQYLIKKGANLDVQDNDGNTPLFWAYGQRNDKATDMLLKSGADEEITNKYGVIYKNVKGKNIMESVDKQGNTTLKEF